MSTVSIPTCALLLEHIASRAEGPLRSQPGQPSSRESQGVTVRHRTGFPPLCLRNCTGFAYFLAARKIFGDFGGVGYLTVLRNGYITARMGARTRATLEEVEELASGDVTWWSGLRGRIAERGLKAAVEEKDAHGWTWGGLWAWIVGDEKRYGEYMQALEAFSQLKAFERLEIVDSATVEDVVVAKLRSETRRDLVGKIDRGRWGETVKVDRGGGGLVVDAGLVGLAGELLMRLGRRGREIEGEVVASAVRDASNQAGLLAAAHMAAGSDEAEEI